jgi:hypothetical protein
MPRRSPAVTRSEYNLKVNLSLFDASDDMYREDCAPGTCYEGACPGDKVWSTDGTCGYQHGNRQCAGKWGDCCNKEGRCGSGEDFCATGRCQSGKCAPGTFRRGWRAALFTYLTGNTTDGTCGGPEAYTCNVVYGNCCNKDGVCGSLESDCGDGW